MNEKPEIIEKLQQLTARIVATNAPGEGLLLIGGFRYRWLDNSARMSMDIDYHWSGDLTKKQKALASLFERRLLPDVKRNFGYEGTVAEASALDESPMVKTIDLAFYKINVPFSRIEIPVDLIIISCLDGPVTRTKNGTVFLTASDADMVESKIISLMLRSSIKQRDLLDLFLFKNSLVSDSAARLERKMHSLHIMPEAIERLLANLEKNRSLHIKALDTILDSQVDPGARRAIRMTGGAELVFETALAIVDKYYRETIKRRQK
jgi:hypothetical protein